MPNTAPRIAILGFAIECNRFSPVTTAADFRRRVDIRGEEIMRQASAGPCHTTPDLPGFVQQMNSGEAWTALPLRIAIAQPGGPVEQAFFDAFLAEIGDGLRQAGPLDGVFVVSHGAALATGSDDPDGDLFALIRQQVGPRVPIVGVFDLHANVSQKMVENLDVFVGYLENPHTDVRERGVEAARHMRELLAGGRSAVLLADVGDNPGGGSRGNTSHLLQALIAADVQGAVLGVFNDEALAGEAQRQGIGASFKAKFNSAEEDSLSQPFEAQAKVLALSDGAIIGRRGLLKGTTAAMGPSALLQIGGVSVAVISNRQQCMEPMQLECLGVQLDKLRTLVVKSRGHFRAGFDENFKPKQIFEVDCPGLTSPNLHNFKWTRLPRPVFPLDEAISWSAPISA